MAALRSLPGGRPRRAELTARAGDGAARLGPTWRLPGLEALAGFLQGTTACAGQLRRARQETALPAAVIGAGPPASIAAR